VLKREKSIMTSPDDKDPVRSELEYAPPWVREQAAREQAPREEAPREEAPREETARDQFRAALRQSGGPAVEQQAQKDSENRRFGDDRPWHQRALEPELVPEPPAGASNLWPMMLRLGAVCTIAAMVAAAVVFLFSPKQIAHKIAQATASAPAGVADDAAPAAIESSRGGPAGVPALAVETSAGVTTPPAQGHVAIVTPSQMPPSQMPPSQIAAATPPQLPEGQIVTAPAKPGPPAESAAPAQQFASLPPPNASPANIRTSPAPGVSEPAQTDPKPAANPAAPPAPAQAAPASVTKPAVVLDENEINTLIRRGKNLLNDGDFAAARVLFERAANAGSAEAALALGSTYDPNVIKRLGAIMVKPDVENARKWYQVAADRGSAAASLQLANLPQGR
jgi:hypothetical protein